MQEYFIRVTKATVGHGLPCLSPILKDDLGQNCLFSATLHIELNEIVVICSAEGNPTKIGNKDER